MPSVNVLVSMVSMRNPTQPGHAAVKEKEKTVPGENVACELVEDDVSIAPKLHVGERQSET